MAEPRHGGPGQADIQHGKPTAAELQRKPGRQESKGGHYGQISGTGEGQIGRWTVTSSRVRTGSPRTRTSQSAETADRETGNVSVARKSSDELQTDQQSRRTQQCESLVAGHLVKRVRTPGLRETGGRIRGCPFELVSENGGRMEPGRAIHQTCIRSAVDEVVAVEGALDTQQQSYSAVAVHMGSNREALLAVCHPRVSRVGCSSGCGFLILVVQSVK